MQKKQPSLSALGLAYAQKKQATLAEAKARFERADRRLNDTWAAAKKSLQPEMFAEIEKVQRQWAKWRDDQARMEAGFQDMARARRDLLSL